jgi:hypothetical protein
MLELARLIHEAVGIESPRKFMFACAIFGAVTFLCLGWLIDKGYRAKLKEQVQPPTAIAAPKSSGDASTAGPNSPAVTGNGNDIKYDQSSSPPKKKAPK